MGFSQLLKCYEVLRFEVQDTTFGVCGGSERSLVFGRKTWCFVYSLGGLKSHCFKLFFTTHLLGFGKNRNLLWQHMKNDHKSRINVCQMERSSASQSKNYSSSFVPWTIRTMVGYIRLNLIVKGILELGCCYKAWGEENYAWNLP